jgi:hypothetical protein
MLGSVSRRRCGSHRGRPHLAVFPLTRVRKKHPPARHVRRKSGSASPRPQARPNHRSSARHGNSSNSIQWLRRSVEARRAFDRDLPPKAHPEGPAAQSCSAAHPPVSVGRRKSLRRDDVRSSYSSRDSPLHPPSCANCTKFTGHSDRSPISSPLFCDQIFISTARLLSAIVSA